MKELWELAADERKQYLEVAAYESEKSFEIIEKDYWVVWILERLFHLPDLEPHLTFKGGTSLSKVYNIIDRFSEDVDVSIEKSFLGFDEKKDPLKLSSKTKQKALLEDIVKQSSEYIQGKMRSDLNKIVADKLGTNKDWQIILDSNDSQTLLFQYPSTSPKGGYIRPIVKIEMGARGEQWPVSKHKIQSYAKLALKEKIKELPVTVRVLNIERTFWEKATILHQYAHIPNDKVLPLRLSRHWYDFFKLVNSEFMEKILIDVSLLERVANHKKIYFPSTWANYDLARKGTLKLIPSAKTIRELAKDYELMQDMFFGKIPKWDLIIETIKDFEKSFNLIT